MSLWRQRKAIERAVAGQLEPRDDAKLRAHLGTCAECRRYYDALTIQARILAGDPHATAVGAERELARLMGAIEPPAKPERARWPRLAMAAGLAAAVVLGIVAWQRATFLPAGDEIVWRGDAAEPKAGFSVWLVTAPQDGGPIRRDVTFPGAPAVVRTDEWVAFSAAQGASGFFRTVLVNAQGQTLVLRGGGSVALDAGSGARTRSRSRPALPRYDDDALAAAARAAGLEGRSLDLPGSPAQASGALTVQP